MKCYSCGQDVPIDGQVILNFGAMERLPNGAKIPDSPELIPILNVSRHDHSYPGGWWDIENAELPVTTNGQADIHFCSADCLDALFAKISAAVRHHQ